jgi:transketolase
MDERSKYLREQILRQFEGGGRGHLGSAFSIVEILRVLYDHILRFNPKNPKWNIRDRFILSKGHGSLALYTVLADKGFIGKKELLRFCRPDSILGGHPEYGISGVEFSTGSLGHGLSVGVGMAIALRNNESRIKNQESRRKEKNHDSCFIIHDSTPRVFVLLGDGECDEGSVWEAALSAGKHKLSNLCVIVDYNKMQSYDTTYKIQNLEPFSDKWKAFGFAVKEVDGHNIKDLKSVFIQIPFDSNKPSVIICHTVKGKGIKQLENDASWHHKSKISEEEIKMLYKELALYE